MCHIFYKRFRNDDTYRNWIDSYNLNTSIAPFTEVCFTSYQQYYDGNPKEEGNLYIGFYSNSRIEKLVKEINEYFSHIKVEIISKYSYCWSGNTSYLKDGKEPKKYRFYVFVVKLDDNYSQSANYVLTLAIAQFIRIFCPEYSLYQRAYDIKDNYIDSTHKVFNSSNGRYGAWSGSECWTKAEFKLLDDIELMNELTKNTDYDRMPYVSELHRKIVGRNRKW